MGRRPEGRDLRARWAGLDHEWVERRMVRIRERREEASEREERETADWLLSQGREGTPVRVKST